MGRHSVNLTTGRYLHAAVFALLVAFGVVPGLVYGISRSYLQYPDADIAFPYWALLMNNGLPLGWYDHPGFFYNLLLAKWYVALKTVGLIMIDSYFELPDRDSFEPVFAQLVYAARVLSLFEIAFFAFVFFWGMKALVDRFDLIAGATLLALASPAIALHMLIVRSELLSATALFGAFFALIAAGNAQSPLRRGWLLAVAGAAAFVAVQTKVIAFVPLCGALIIAPLFVRSVERRPLPLEPATRWLIRLSALTVILPFASDVVRLWEGIRSYQIAIVGIIVIGLAGLIRRRSGSTADMVDALAWFAIGIGTGYLLNAAHYESGNIQPLLYFVDHVVRFAHSLEPGTVDRSTMALVVLRSLVHRLYLIATDMSGVTLVYVAALVALAMAMRRREWLLALRIAVLILLDLGTSAVFGIRGSAQYAIYYYFWTVIALAIGLEPFLRIGRLHKATVKVVWIAVLIAAGSLQLRNLEPGWQPVPLNQACVQAQIYVHRLRDYWSHYCAGESVVPPGGR